MEPIGLEPTTYWLQTSLLYSRQGFLARKRGSALPEWPVFLQLRGIFRAGVIVLALDRCQGSYEIPRCEHNRRFGGGLVVTFRGNSSFVFSSHNFQFQQFHNDLKVSRPEAIVVTTQPRPHGSLGHPAFTLA